MSIKRQNETDDTEVEKLEEETIITDVDNMSGRYNGALYGEETSESDDLNSPEAELDEGLGRDARQQSDMEEIIGDIVDTEEDDMDEVNDPNAISGQDEKDSEEDDQEAPELLDVPM